MEFPTAEFKIKKDSYLKSRDGNSKFLYITCCKCDEPLMIYQKDGKGGLLRLYFDRIVWMKKSVNENNNVLVCSSCLSIIANHMIYEPEKRPAYRLIPGTIHTYRSIERSIARLK